MNSAIIIESSNLNHTDSVLFDGVERAFEYDAVNDSGKDLILLYMYQLPDFPQHGIKIGMTKCNRGVSFKNAIKSRISVQVKELALDPSDYEKYGMKREILHWGICLDARDDSFKDYYVHESIKIKKAGIQEKEQEWFVNVPLSELVRLFEECRTEGKIKELFEPRKEQRECVDRLKEYFTAHPKDGRFLLNCKMRFGKSYTTYKFCEEMDLERVLILTFVPAVESSWRSDLAHIQKNYSYYTDDDLRRIEFNPANIDDPFVMFLSLQNFLGKEWGKQETKTRIKKLQSVKWDLVILDEYHFGAWNDRTRRTFAESDQDMEEFDEDYLKDLSPDVVKRFQIRTDRTICLSGTPFKALESREFGEAVFSYTYFDEQRNKYPNSEADDFRTVDPNYAQFPDMKIFGYNMGEMFGDMQGVSFYNQKYKRYFFSLNKFFETRHEVNPSDPVKFINEDEVKRWLNIIKSPADADGYDFPYFRGGELVSNNRHSLWLMPSVDSTTAMSEILRKDPYFKGYEIINLSDPRAGVGLDAYKYLMEGINRAENTGKLGSIALTVNKLTLGVTVKPWSTVFVLKDLASPEQYFQSIFRIQTPYRNGDEVKEYGYVYDFNVDRAALLMLQFATESGENPRASSVVRAKVAKLIVKYLPIYLNGNMAHPISEEVFYNLADYSDPRGQPLSKKITDTSKTTRIGDDETIALMMADPEVKKIVDRVFAHAKFSKPKTTTPIPDPPEDFDKEITARGRDLGYSAGKGDHDLFSRIGDDEELSSKFLEMQKIRAEDCCPPEYQDKPTKYKKYYNAFVKGYESGVNMPVKKITSGKADGKAFVAEIQKKFGKDITWTKETSPELRSYINTHLNDINNIPADCRCALYKKWYCDSFTAAVRNDLRPKKDVPKETVENADNVIRHILSRLFEFLYISVYRETTFDEIFKNADPDTFLEAVGITKDEFTVLNRYHIFEEQTLNSCIHDFFVNESLGSTLDLGDEENRRRYRNSFDWYGFGVTDTQ